MEKEWIRIKGFGKLEVEIVLVTFDVPILFVCKDSEKKCYLVMCFDEDDGEYVIVEESTSNIIQMLENRKTMEEVFRDATKQKIYFTKYDFVEKKIYCDRA